MKGVAGDPAQSGYRVQLRWEPPATCLRISGSPAFSRLEGESGWGGALSEQRKPPGVQHHSQVGGEQTDLGGDVLGDSAFHRE